MITVRSTINLAHQSVPNIIPVVQGDTGRAILFTLADFTIPEGATARYFVMKPSGLAVYNDATIDGNTVLVELTAQSIIETGDNYGQVRISVGEDIVTSFDFILHVDPFRGIDAVESDAEVNIFDRALEQAQETVDTMVENAEQAIEDAAEAAAEAAEDVLESIPADYTALSNKVDDLKNALNVLTDFDASAITWIEGYFPYGDGSAVQTLHPNGNCKTSSPIYLRKGYTIFVSCSGYEGIVSIITEATIVSDTSVTNNDGIPLVKDTGTGLVMYSYTAPKDMLIRITYYYGGNIPIDIRIATNIQNLDLSLNVIELNATNLASADIYTTTGFHQYSGWVSTDYIDISNIKKIAYIASRTFSTIYQIAFFDESKEFISGILPSTNSASYVTVLDSITIPTGTKYIRVPNMVTASDTAKSYLCLVMSNAGTSGEVSYEYKFNKSIDMTNRFVSDKQYLGTSATSSYSSWYSSDFIDLSNIKSIKTLTTVGHTVLNAITFFDNSKTPTRGIIPSVANEVFTKTDIAIEAGEKYAIVSWGEITVNGSITRSCDVVFDVLLKEPEAEKADFSYLVSQFDNILCIGDSLTEGDYGSYPEGTANNHSKNYPHYLQRFLNTVVTNKGHDGTYPRWWWSHRLTELDTTIDYDCIFFFLGTNYGLTDTIDEDTSEQSYEDYADTETGRYCSMVEWLMEVYPNAKIFLISFPHNYRLNSWYVTNNNVLRKIGAKYSLPVVDMTVDVPFTRYNGDIYRPVGYDPNGTQMAQLFGNLHFGTLGYQTFAKYLIKNTGKVMSENLVEYKGKLD